MLARDRHGVAHLGQVDVLHPGDEVADLPGPQLGDGRGFGGEHPALLRLRIGVRRHQMDLGPRRQHPVLHPDVGHHAAVGVERGIEHQGAQRILSPSLRRRHELDHLLQQRGHTLAGFGRDPKDVLRIPSHELSDLARRLLRIGLRQVDLVQRGDDRQAGVAGEVEVREGLGLDPLGRVDEQHGALARREGARDLVGEVDVARRVDEVQHVRVVELVREPHGLRLDGDAPLPLQVHPVQVLVPHVPCRHRVGELEDPVGQRGLAVVDVGHDAEVPKAVGLGHGGSILPGRRPAASERALTGRSAIPRW